MRKILNSLSATNTKMIKYSDFLGMVYDAKALLDEENLWIAFKHFDEDNDN